MNGESKRTTAILPVDIQKIGSITTSPEADDLLDAIHFELDSESPDATHIRLAAEQLRHSDIPVAFPTETVYGLGADATRSSAVNGIYKAKQRPADNPLIVHFSSLKQLRSLLTSTSPGSESNPNESKTNGQTEDPIPAIYKPLISKYWPGPLTMILPNPSPSPLAPEVTAGLDTFGARMPRHVLALALIDLANRPIAAPSANASTKPSPTAAEHVYHDLNGRIESIIDGGPCDVGVESTVVDGLSDPPLILRPGGISIEQIRSCPGWENTQIGYKSFAESGSQPKAPGMKYRHYSPKAPVVLYEAGKSAPDLDELMKYSASEKKLGVVTTKNWSVDSSQPNVIRQSKTSAKLTADRKDIGDGKGFRGMLETLDAIRNPRTAMRTHNVKQTETKFAIAEISLGSDVTAIARGIFSALRELDRENVDAILVEGIDDAEGDTAAAVMNRLRKAAEIKETSDVVE